LSEADTMWEFHTETGPGRKKEGIRPNKKKRAIGSAIESYKLESRLEKRQNRRRGGGQ